MHSLDRSSIPIRPGGFVLLGLFISCVLASPSEAGWVTQKPFVGEGNRVWYTDGHALYRYNGESRDWAPVPIPGFEKGTIYDIGVDYGLLWVATDQGVYRFDIHLEHWLHYGKPVVGTDRSTALAFGEDFVWIAGDRVLARFDRYVETWETLDIFEGTGAIRDMAVDAQYVWLVTETGIIRYDPSFHQVRTFSEADGALPGEIWETFAFGGDTWFWGDQGLCRYEAELETWTVYGAEEGLPIDHVREIVSEGRDLWLISSEDVFRFDGRSEKWAPFVDVQRLRGHTPSEGRSLHAMAHGGERTWFGTENGLYGYRTGSGEWDILRKADGLSSDEILGVFVRGDLLFCVHRDGIDGYDGGEWRGMSFAEMRRSYRTRRVGMALKDDGLSLQGSGANAVRLGGRYRYTAEWEGEGTGEGQFKAASVLSGTFSGGRTSGGYYDNTDLDDVRFGGTYRGAEGDVVRRLSGGEIRAEAVRYGTSPFKGLGGAISLIGGEAQMGPFHYQRRDEQGSWALRLWGGRGHSRFAQVFFRGADGPMFRLAHRRIVPGSMQIRVDGEVIESRLYTVSLSLGVFFFRQERFVPPDAEIEVFYEYEDDDLEEDMFRGQTGWDFSETLSLGASIFRRWGKAPEEALDIGEVYGQVRWRSAARDLDVRLIPELSFSRTGKKTPGRAGQVHLIATWSDLQLNGVWKEFGEAFKTIGQRTLAFGDPRRIVDLSCRYPIGPSLPLDIEWRREEAEEGREDRWSAGILLSEPVWPQLALKFARTTARSSWMRRSLDQWTLRSRWDLTQLPLLPGRMDRLLVRGHYQQMDRTEDTDSLSTSSRSQNAWLSLDVMPTDRLSSKADLWWSRVQGHQERHRWIGQLHAVDVVPGMRAFAQFEGERSAQFKGEVQEISLDGTMLLNAAIRPGAWFGPVQWITLYPQTTWSRKAARTDVPKGWSFLRTLRELGSPPLSEAFTQELRATLELGPNASLTEILSKERQDQYGIHTRRKNVVISRLDIHRGDDRFLLRHEVASLSEVVWTETERESSTQQDASVRWWRRWPRGYRTDGQLRYTRGRTGPTTSHRLKPSIELFSHIQPRRFLDNLYLRPAVSFEWTENNATVDHRWTGRLRLDLNFLRAWSQRVDVEAVYQGGQVAYELYAQLRADF